MTSQASAGAKAVVEQFIEEVGQTINGQITITYDTRQTLDKFLELRFEEAQAESPNSFLEHNFLFDDELFLEYVVDNVAEEIRNRVESYSWSMKELNREIALVSGEGAVIVEPS
jgi:uncharacterized protein YlzI (FlbEa/FlbD family)